MSEKVKLPKEVAEAIESLRNKGYVDSDILEATLSVHDHIDEVEVLSRYFNNSMPNSPRSYDVLMRALVNGYVVETSEEALRKEYRHLQTMIERYGHYSAMGKAIGICNTLDTLGIKIEGINDEKMFLPKIPNEVLIQLDYSSLESRIQVSVVEDSEKEDE